jgi:DNA-binding MarR family transcriptional regulator
MSLADDVADQISDAASRFVRGFGLHQWQHVGEGRPISTAMAGVLAELRRDGPLRQSEVERRLRLGRSSASRIVAVLVERAWVSRAPARDDRRGIVITLTVTGVRVADELARARRAHMAVLLERIPPERQADVVNALLTIADAVERVTLSPNPPTARPPMIAPR